MATFWKDNKLAGRLLGLILLAVFAAALALVATPIYKSSQASLQNLADSSDFVGEVDRYAYALYWKLQQQQNGVAYTPTDAYYPTLRASEEEQPADQVLDTEERWRAAETVDTLVEAWYSEFVDKMGNFDYLVRDDENGLTLGTLSPALTQLADGGDDDETLAHLQEQYQFYGVLRFDEKGSLTVSYWYGGEQSAAVRLGGVDLGQAVAANQGRYDGMEAGMGRRDGPKNMTLALTIPVQLAPGEYMYYQQSQFGQEAFFGSGFRFYYYLGALLSMLAALLLSLRKKWEMQSALSARLPFEAALLGIFLTFGMQYAVGEMVYAISAGALLDSQLGQSMPAPALALLGGMLLFGIILVFYWCAYAGTLSLLQIRETGLASYFPQKSLLWRLGRAVRRGVQALAGQMNGIDLADKSNRKLLYLLLGNFVLLSIICCCWVFGIAFLVVYTLVLFAVLRRYIGGVRANYSVLLHATHSIAQGRLDTPVTGDLGVFNPLKNELAGVQTGFLRAVEAEGRSQTMKTELITNVSHDLKTPLTAIITYVDLLKNEDITPEERRRYVDTLDKKSQRLKTLIEDLFDMSKAASRDIQMNYAAINLPGLIRQVATDCSEALAGAGIELHCRFPAEKVELLLDGEKTSRVFENLFTNIVKYGQPGTRAFVTLQTGEGQAQVEVKNTSRDPLSLEGRDLTERFVRGDQSRNTEGSGLGLAIAKSFVELQNGRFFIDIDGDLFKAVLAFPLPEQPAPQSPPLPAPS